jgi:hypothetical protein
MGSRFDDWIYWTSPLHLHFITTAYTLNSFLTESVLRIAHCCLNFGLVSSLSNSGSLDLYSKSKSKLYYDRRSAGQSVLEQSTHLGLTTRSWLSDSCGFVGLGRPLWREDGSALCNCYWLSPAQSFSGPSPVGLVAIFYCLRFETSFSSPPTTRRVTVEVFDPSPHG